jgi:DNA repair protein RadA/Sms
MANEGNVRKIVTRAEELKPALIILDSLGTSWLEGVDAAEGSADQVKACVQHLTSFGKKTGTALILIAHVLKSGEMAGPRAAEHLVDTIVVFEPLYDDHGEPTVYREMTCARNRNASGPGVARATFEMTQEGLKPVAVSPLLDH